MIYDLQIHEQIRTLIIESFYEYAMWYCTNC